MGQIEGFTSGLVAELRGVESGIDTLVGHIRDEEGRIAGHVSGLLSGPQAFVGEAADISHASMQDVSASVEAHVRALEQIAGSIHNTIWRIHAAVESAEANILDPRHLEEALSRLTYDALAREGGDAVHAVLQDMANTLANMARQGGSYFSDLVHANFGGALDDVGTILGDAGHLVVDGWELLGNLPNVLIQWGWDIFHALDDLYHWLWNQADAVVHRLLVPAADPRLQSQHLAQSDLADPSNQNEQALYQDISSQYATGAPIGITQIGPNRILVTIAGLEPTKLDQANNFPGALDAGLGDANNAYTLDVRKAIEGYLRSHPIIKQPVIVELAGHSYGGIVAQQLAMQGGQTEYNIDRVITFGSPQVGPEQRGVRYTEYFDRYDPVPLLSWYKDSALLRGLGPVRSVEVIAGINYGPAEAKQAFTGETYVPDVGQNPLSPIGDHSAYGDSHYLRGQSLPFPVTQWGSTA